MRKLCGGLGLVAMLVFGAPAASAQKAGMDTLSRTGQWVVNFDPASCDLLAQFGPKEDPAFLQFTRYSPGDDTSVTVLNKRLRSSEAWLKASFDFGTGRWSVPAVVAGISQRSLPGILVSGVRFDGFKGEGMAPEITPAQEAAITGVIVKVEGKKPFRLEFGSLGRPMAIMRQCLDGLIKSWGYDPAVIKGLSRRLAPAGSPATWVSDNDFPEKALGHNGFLRFRLDVDENGKVAGCNILDRTKPDDFATVTCAILSKRARFKPALDANGAPVRAFYMGSFSWKS